jgi:hypothetical protein
VPEHEQRIDVPSGRTSSLCYYTISAVRFAGGGADVVDTRRLAMRSPAEAIGYVVGFFFFPVLVMLLIGGIAYLVKRPQLTFRQAILQRWVIITAVVIWLLGICGQLGQRLPS